MKRKSETLPPAVRYLWMSDLQIRYGRGSRQLKRWIATGVLPPPDLTVHNHEAWRETSLDEADKKNTRAAGATTEFGRRKAVAAE
jgi:hypothetical protein